MCSRISDLLAGWGWQTNDVVGAILFKDLYFDGCLRVQLILGSSLPGISFSISVPVCVEFD